MQHNKGKILVLKIERHLYIFTRYWFWEPDLSQLHDLPGKVYLDFLIRESLWLWIWTPSLSFIEPVNRWNFGHNILWRFWNILEIWKIFTSSFNTLSKQIMLIKNFLVRNFFQFYFKNPEIEMQSSFNLKFSLIFQFTKISEKKIVLGWLAICF